MKRMLFTSILLCLALMQALAFEYTDTNGVTWRCSLNSNTHEATLFGASGYGAEVTVPETVYDGDEAYTVIGLSGTFYGSKTVRKVTLANTVRTLGEQAFWGCSSLISVENMDNVTYIGGRAFSSCSVLTSVNMPQVTSIGEETFFFCSSLASVNMPQVISIGDKAFYSCSRLASLDMSQVTSIGDEAFSGCYGLSSVDLPKIKILGTFSFSNTNIKSMSLPNTLQTLGEYCFASVRLITFNATTPPVANGSKLFSSNTIVKVPEGAIDAYRKADVWSSYASQILSMSDVTDYDVTTTAQDKTAGLMTAIGQDNLDKVISLKVKGTINSYDIILIRNKMPRLTYLDLSDANIVACDYEYYTGCHTEDHVVGNSMFSDMSNLLTLQLPNTTTSIGDYAIKGCTGLVSFVVPNSVERIGLQAFASFDGGMSLENVQFPPSLKSIGQSVFYNCNRLREVQFPGLETIGAGAFQSCLSLEEVHLPSTLQSIGDNAFDCQNLKRVYAYTVEPVSISQNTFSNYASATLYRPIQARENYYWNTEWSQFGQSVDFDEPYKYFYVNKDYTLDERFDGNPDIDVNPGGGLELPDNDKGNQDADTIHIKGDGKNWASIIANGNLNAKGLYVDITIRANRWYFFSFPFRVKRTNISCGAGARFVFRRYDGALRAEHGHGGWIDVDSEYLEPWKGYIFQASIDCTLSVKIEKEQFGLLPKIDAKVDLEAHASANEQDASWNFVGNPFTSYYDINDMGYDCPITRWNSDTNSYEALRPGDDDYALHPFEAFFVQRPTDADQIGFSGDDRMTQIGSAKRAQTQAQKARVQGQFDVSRQIVNLSLSDGQTTDKTRVVFNAGKTQAYERDCDAAKFDVAGASQLYTIEAQGGRMAINERPEGSVQIGFSADRAGDYVLSATRMDRPVLLRDNLLQTTYDLTQGDYHFSSEAGRYDHRFMLIIDKGTTGIADIVKTTGVNVKPTDSGLNITHLDGHTLHVYGINGALYATRTTDGFLTLAKGVYVVEVDGLKAKFMVK